MRIAFFSDSFYPEISGVSDSMIATAQELARLGHTVKFFAPKYSKKNFQVAGIASKRELDLDGGIEIERFCSVPYPTANMQGRMVFPFCLRTINIKKFNPDVIHSHLFFGVGLEALIAAKILNVPFVGTNHTAITEFVRYAPIKAGFLEPLSLKYVNWYYGKCSFVSAPSQSVFDEMCDSGFDRPRKVVSNPVFNDAFNNDYNFDKKVLKEKFGINDKTIVYAGRLAPEKNIEVIISALALAKKKIPNITLAVAGHGAHLDVIKKQIEELGLNENVKFFGTLGRYELADLYKSGEIFAITSKSETQSMTLIQAMACGLPTIGVRARALPEYIEGNGILVQPDDAEGLAVEFVKLLENNDLRNELSEKSLEFVKKFSAKNIALEWEEIYSKTVTDFKK